MLPEKKATPETASAYMSGARGLSMNVTGTWGGCGVLAMSNTFPRQLWRLADGGMTWELVPEVGKDGSKKRAKSRAR